MNMICSVRNESQIFNVDFEEFYEYTRNADNISRDILRINNELQDKIDDWNGGSKELAEKYCIVTDYCWNPVDKRIEGFPNPFHLDYPIQRKSSKFILRLAAFPNGFETDNLMSIEDVLAYYNLSTISTGQFVYLFDGSQRERLIRLDDIDSFAKNIFQPAIVKLANQMNFHTIQPNGMSFFDVFVNNYFTLEEYFEYSHQSLNDAISQILQLSMNSDLILNTGSQLNRDNLHTLIRLMQNKNGEVNEENVELIATFLSHIMFDKNSKSAHAYSNKELSWLNDEIKKFG